MDSFCFKVKVVIIYDFVKIIYTIRLRIRDRHEKGVENSLPELRVTTPSNLTSISTPNRWRFGNLFLIRCPRKDVCGKLEFKNSLESLFYNVNMLFPVLHRLGFEVEKQR